MEKITTINEIKNKIKSLKNNDNTIGFVPTMGALHEGHLSLMREAKKQNDILVVSVFVNPLQFGPDEDFNKYPRNIDKDIEAMKKYDVDIVFNPLIDELYKEPVLVKIEIPELFNKLCGKSRPGHFSGVCVVVSKLMNIIQPDNMYMGKKDYQQLTITQKLVKDLNFQTNVIGLPIIRDEYGIALSSRNAFLSNSEKKRAISINESRYLVGKMYLKNHSISEIRKAIIDKLKSNDLKIDYVEILDGEILSEVTGLKKTHRIFIAAFVGKTRLIDNFSFGECVELIS